MENTNQKPGLGAWLYALLGTAALIGSLVIAVSSFIRLEIITGILYMAIPVPVFSLLAWAFGWKVIRTCRRARKETEEK